MLAHKSTNEGDRSPSTIFVGLVSMKTNAPSEKLWGVVKIKTSKKVVDLHDINATSLNKDLKETFICFSSLDATNAMSGELSDL